MKHQKVSKNLEETSSLKKIDYKFVKDIIESLEDAKHGRIRRVA